MGFFLRRRSHVITENTLEDCRISCRRAVVHPGHGRPDAHYEPSQEGESNGPVTI